VNTVDVSSITISWTLVDSITPTTRNISYSNTNNTLCFIYSLTLLNIHESSTNHTIHYLEEATEYVIIVSVSYDGGSISDKVAATTLPAGKIKYEVIKTTLQVDVVGLLVYK